MEVRGKVVSVSGNVAEVCILKENVSCGDCSACFKKMGSLESIIVAAIPGLQAGQEILLCDSKSWLAKNKIVFAVFAFVLGVVAVEGLSVIVSFGGQRQGVDLLGGAIASAIVFIVLWVKKPRYLLKIVRIDNL